MARFTRLAITITMAAAMATGTACSSGAGNDEAGEPDGAGAPEVTFEGELVYMNGSAPSAIDGQTGTVLELGTLEGEIGWSGFIRLVDGGSLIYESLVSDFPSVRLASAEGADTTLFETVEGIHDFDDGRLLVSDAEDLYVVDTGVPASAPQPLGVGPCLDAAFSQDHSEIAYVQSITQEGAEDATGEREQRLMIRETDGTSGDTEVIRGWHAIEPLLVGTESLLVAAHPFGGIGSADVLLVDRGSTESTTVAAGVTVLKTHRISRSIAVASATAGDADSDILSIITLNDEGSAVTTRFEGVPAGSITALEFRADGAGVVATLSHEDGATSLMLFDTADGSQATVAEWSDARCTGLLAHADGRTVFLVLEANDVSAAPETTRSIVASDLVDRAVATLAEPDRAGLVELVGVR